MKSNLLSLCSLATPRNATRQGRRLQPNPFPLLRFFNPSVLRTPPLYFAVQNTEEEFKSNPPFIADLIISFYCFCFDPLALRVFPLYSLTETQGKRLRCIPLSPLLRFYEPCSAMLRGTAREEFKSCSLFIADLIILFYSSSFCSCAVRLNFYIE